MIIKKYAHKAVLAGLGSLLSLGLTVPASFAVTAPEFVTEAKENSQDTLRQGLPGRRLGGGTRGDRIFTDAYAYLAALVTSDNLSQTTAAQPTLLFSVPNMVAAQEAEFILRDGEGEDIYRTMFKLSGDAGLVSLDLSETSASPLRIDEDYRWYFSIVSAQSEVDRAEDIVVHGNIRRVQGNHQPDAVAAANALPIELRIASARALYEEEDLWHDAAVVLYAMRQDHPDNLTVAAEWERLVDFAGLSAVL